MPNHYGVLLKVVLNDSECQLQLKKIAFRNRLCMFIKKQTTNSSHEEAWKLRQS